MDALIIYLILINAAAALLMLTDKHRAQKKQWRIPESTLLTIAAIGGSFGALLSMHLIRHKTKHIKFAVGLPILFALHVLLLSWLIPKIA